MIVVLVIATSSKKIDANANVFFSWYPPYFYNIANKMPKKVYICYGTFY